MFSISAPGGIYAGTIAPTGNGQFYAAEEISGHGHYGFLDVSRVTHAVSTHGHASFADFTEITGTVGDHHNSFQAFATYTHTGLRTYAHGFYSLPMINGAGEIQYYDQFSAANVITPSGQKRIKKFRGFHCDNLDGGIEENFAFHSDGPTPWQAGGPVYSLDSFYVKKDGEGGLGGATVGICSTNMKQQWRIKLDANSDLAFWNYKEVSNDWVLVKTLTRSGWV